MNCENCEHWRQTDSGGECHRYAPRPALLAFLPARATVCQVHWPTTAADDTYGEYAPNRERRLERRRKLEMR